MGSIGYGKHHLAAPSACQTSDVFRRSPGLHTLYGPGQQSPDSFHDPETGATTGVQYPMRIAGHVALPFASCRVVLYNRLLCMA